MSVYDIPIVEITEQYLEYLNKMEEFDLEISSEFFVYGIGAFADKVENAPSAPRGGRRGSSSKPCGQAH
ncbi:MAG: segregation/condensation protein A [Clostridiales bacterium]|nr:MAG: segregation/condensation protein A [Clostridiales bacterium]